MGRKSTRTSTKAKGKTYNFVSKQIVLKGITLEMFNYDRDLRNEISDLRKTTDSSLGSEIIANHYRNNPPKGFKPKD